MPFLNQLEPASLVRQFVASPPEGFVAWTTTDGLPAFATRFDVLTTAEPALRQRIQRWPLYRLWRGLLRLRTVFVGSTVSEYAWLAGEVAPIELAGRLRRELAPSGSLLIVKDIPQSSPLLDAAANRYCADFTAACEAEGFVLVEGQALAWLPIDFETIEDYLARLSPGRRRDIRRKLRARNRLEIQAVATGDAIFDQPATIDAFYALFLRVHAQSEVHFDLLSRDFFAAVLADKDGGGVVFVYRAQGRMIGWNLCYEYRGMLVDKYIGLDYPAAREHNLYVVSWMENLEYARAHGLSQYVAGWTDPAIKRQLGARLTFTRHAVRLRNPLLRAILRRVSRYFESDRSTLEAGLADAPGHS